jgi:hypothetical protein
MPKGNLLEKDRSITHFTSAQIKYPNLMIKKMSALLLVFTNTMRSIKINEVLFTLSFSPVEIKLFFN